MGDLNEFNLTMKNALKTLAPVLAGPGDKFLLENVPEQGLFGDRGLLHRTNGFCSFRGSTRCRAKCRAWRVGSGMTLRPCPNEITVHGVRLACTSTVERSWKLRAKDGGRFREDLTESTSDEELRMMVVRKISEELGPFKWHLDGMPSSSGGEQEPLPSDPLMSVVCQAETCWGRSRRSKRPREDAAFADSSFSGVRE